MANYTADQIAAVLSIPGNTLAVPDRFIQHLIMDTRKIANPDGVLFFALKGNLHDGHNFIQDVIQKGVKNIVLERLPKDIPGDVNIFKVDNSLKALQRLAAWHRAQFPELTTLAITGSNGKTTVKEWLYQMITDRIVVKSPKSYNSQTGVALSLWQIQEDDRLGIFEAGISKRDEMTALESMIQPDTGLITMIGDAHAEGFDSDQEKLEEKLILFRNCSRIVYEADNIIVDQTIRRLYPDKQLLSWGEGTDATLFIIEHKVVQNNQVIVSLRYNGQLYELVIPFYDRSSVQNALHCIAVMLLLDMDKDTIQEGLFRIQNIPMRLELLSGSNNNILINDTYNADLQSLKIALDFLDQQAGNRKKAIILSDFMQTGLSPSSLLFELKKLIDLHDIQMVITVGTQIEMLRSIIEHDVFFHNSDSTEALLAELPHMYLQDMAILVKGARVYQMERVIHLLSDKAHTAILETNLQAIEHNLGVFSRYLSGSAQIIAVIKASAYGSGSEELAKFLEFKKVTYIAVALVDEGVQLRQQGITLPIIILNPDKYGIREMEAYQLEPEIYDMYQLYDLVSYLSHKSSKFKIHLKLDTGMRRLGFLKEELPQLCQILVRSSQELEVQTIFSHLSSSENPDDDSFTHFQVTSFMESYNYIVDRIGYKPGKHILNSSGIIRFPEYHFDYVRLGLGLYGIDGTGIFSDQLEKVHTLKASVVQIKNIKADESVGYNRRGKATKNGRIAIINIGYADGLMRLAGNGNYSVRIRGIDFPVMGSVCMDLTITDIGDNDEISTGDEVIIFGKDKPIEVLAASCQTIPYEILTRISGRVKRYYVNA